MADPQQEPAKPDYYEVLGVAREATPEAIKQAWRKASSAAHPDRKGGSAERQQAVNKAYEVLSDPQRRAEYDKHGVDHDADSIIEEGRMMLVELFDRAIADEMVRDIVGHVGAQLRVRVADCDSEIAAAHKIVARFKRMRGRVRRKGEGSNLFEQIVDKKIAKVEATIPQNQRLRKLVQSALQQLADYESVEPDTFDTRSTGLGKPGLPGGDAMRFFLGGGR